MNGQSKQEFSQTPEAQEYIQKLQAGKVELPSDASRVERDALAQLQELSKGLRQMTTASNDMEKEIANLTARRQQLAREIDTVSGEMTGYAKLLVASEGYRREEGKGTKVPKDKAEEKADSKPEPEAKMETKGGNGKVTQLKPKAKAETKAEAHD